MMENGKNYHLWNPFFGGTIYTLKKLQFQNSDFQRVKSVDLKMGKKVNKKYCLTL